jgi:hypothetical protein
MKKDINTQICGFCAPRTVEREERREKKEHEHNKLLSRLICCSSSSLPPPSGVLRVYSSRERERGVFTFAPLAGCSEEKKSVNGNICDFKDYRCEVISHLAGSGSVEDE